MSKYCASWEFADRYNAFRLRNDGMDRVVLMILDVQQDKLAIVTTTITVICTVEFKSATAL